MNLDSEYFSGIAAAGSHDYFALLFCPHNRREEFRTLLAFEKTLNDLSHQLLDPDVRQAKLGWWANELSRLPSNESVHPVTIAASEVLSRNGVPAEPMLELFSAVVRESGESPPTNPNELLEHADSRGAILPLFGRVLLAPDPISEASHNACAAIGGGRYLATLFGADHRNHPHHRLADQNAPAGTATMEGQLTRRQLDRIRAILPEVPEYERRRLVPVMVLARLLHDDLEGALQGQDYESVSPLRYLTRAWRSARRASRGKLPFPINPRSSQAEQQ